MAKQLSWIILHFAESRCVQLGALHECTQTTESCYIFKWLYLLLSKIVISVEYHKAITLVPNPPQTQTGK